MSKDIKDMKDIESNKVESIVPSQLEELEQGSRERIEKIKDDIRSKYRRGEQDYMGRLYIDPKHKKPGKTLRIDNDDPQTRQHLERLGYSVVRDKSIKIGQGHAGEAHNLGSEIHIEQAIYGTSQPGVLYEIDSDILAAREELQAEVNDLTLKSKIDANSNDKHKRK